MCLAPFTVASIALWHLWKVRTRHVMEPFEDGDLAGAVLTEDGFEGLVRGCYL